MNTALDIVSRRAPKWQAECQGLRKIILSSGLTEKVKWGWPCYMSDDANIVLIHAFRDYCAVLFFKGALLKDTKGILQAPGQSQAGRQMRFTNSTDVEKLEPTLKAYIKEAIAVEQSGQKVKMKQTSDYEIPTEFKKKLDADPGLKKAFRALTPGRQRQYIFYFSQAKRPETREVRITTWIPQILKGKGLND